MVSLRNYFTITAIMVVVFFMFLFTNVVLEGWKGYEENAYAEDRESLTSQVSAYEAGQDTKSVLGNSRERIAYIGSADSALGKVVQNWVNYTKRELDVYGTVGECAAAGGAPELLMIDAEHVDWSQASVCGQLEKCAQQGIDLVFCNLPEASVVKENRKLMQLLGIEGIREEQTTVEGIHLYKGFLLGDEIVYRSANEEEFEKKQDMELTFPWYELSEDATVYMCGLPDEELKVKVEERPPVIWRMSSSDAQVFAVNGDYMQDVAGLGILAAMSAKTGEGYALYPIVNAQNMVILNCPAMAPEYGDAMEARYGQSMTEMFRNIVWPSIVSVYRRSTLGLSCMVTPQYDYEDDNFPSQTELEFYMKRLKEQGAEAGLSGESLSNTPISQKLDEDERFINQLLPDYQFSSFYAGTLTSLELDRVLEGDMLEAVRTVVKDFDGGSQVFEYQSEHITSQSILSDGVGYTYRDDFRMRCVETALGYANVGMDVGAAIYPSGDQDDVDRLISDFTWNVTTYWKKFGAFSGTTLSESDQKIRNFLALDYEESREGNEITLDFTGMAPAWFILRTDGERVSHVEGGEWRMLEQGAYLIEANNGHVTIRL